VARRLDRLPGPLRAAIIAAGSRMPPRGKQSSTFNRVRRLATSLSLDPVARYARNMSYFNAVERELLYTDDYKQVIGDSLAPEVIAGPWAEATGAAPIDVMLEVDIETYLPGDLLVKMDIATMAHSLEARSPFLDHELMEFAATLPPDLKLRRLEKKYILREALREWLPPEVLDRPKMGFGVPIVDWFRHDLREYVEDVLMDREARARGYFQEGYVRSLLDRHTRGAEDNAYKIWALLMLEMWHRTFIDEPVKLAAAA
jgi:asparagine synthase (glutamine-hydrolysing)